MDQEKKYSELIDNLRIGIYRNTPGPQGRFLEVNQAMVDMFEAGSKEELMRHNVSDIYSDPSKRQCFSDMILQQGFLKNAELELRSFKGRKFTASVTVVMKKNSRGEPYFDGIMEDISQRKEAEREQARLAAIVESSDDAIIGKDLDGTIRSWNKGAEAIYGYTAGEAVGRDILMLAPPGAADEIHGILDAVKDGKALKNIMTTRLRKDGSAIDVLLTVSPIRDVSGRIIGASTIAHDITEIKRRDGIIRKINGLQALLLDPGTLDNKLKTITDGVIEIFSADFARIWLVERADRCNSGCPHAAAAEGPHVCRNRERCLHLIASSGRYTHTNGGHARVPIGCYKIGGIASGEYPSFLTNDVANDPRVHNHQWAKELGLVSFAGFRLRPPHGDTIGVMALFSKHVIPPDEFTLLEGLSNTVVRVMQTAGAEAELQMKMRDLERFNKVAVDRELRMIELKKKIAGLESKLKEKGA